MTIETKESADNLYVKVRGRLDAATILELEGVLKPKLSETRELVLDFERLVYISSAGLRLILKIQKEMDQKDGRLIIRNVNDVVGDVLEVTGFVDFLNIE